MNGLPYYKRYPRDLFEGTVGMPLELKGPYGLVLDLIYLHGGALVDDPQFIAGQLGTSVRMWNKIRGQLVAMGKLRAEGGSIRNGRADQELAETAEYRRTKSENRARPNRRSPDYPGIISGSSQDNTRETQADASKNNDLPTRPSSIQITDTEKREAKASQRARAKEPERFAEFWAIYPRRKERKAAVEKFRTAVNSGVDPGRIIEGARRYAAERAGQDPKFTKHPKTWLGNGCWDDEPEPQPQRGPDERPRKRSAYAEAIREAADRERRRAAERDVADGADCGDAFDLSPAGRGRGRHEAGSGALGGLPLGPADGGDRAGDPPPTAIVLPLVAGSWRN